MGVFLQKIVSWGNTVWTVIGWFGWKQLVISFLISVGTGFWAITQGVPTSIILMAAFCVFVAGVYLTKIPAFARATQQIKPVKHSLDVDVWKHKTQFTLVEAACLLAGLAPTNHMLIPAGNAQAWFTMLVAAIRDKEIDWIKTRFDPNHTFPDGYQPNLETPITKDSLKKFAEKRNQKPPFLFS